MKKPPEREAGGEGGYLREGNPNVVQLRPRSKSVIHVLDCELNPHRQPSCLAWLTIKIGAVIIHDFRITKLAREPYRLAMPIGSWSSLHRGYQPSVEFDSDDLFRRVEAEALAWWRRCVEDSEDGDGDLQ